MDGIFNINKATGMTSHDVVAKIRKLIKQKRVGHAGTLDPAASGVLPICVGQATRVAEYLSESGKAYSAEIVLPARKCKCRRVTRPSNSRGNPHINACEQVRKFLWNPVPSSSINSTFSIGNHHASYWLSSAAKVLIFVR